jgi:hypothetical protein
MVITGSNVSGRGMQFVVTVRESLVLMERNFVSSYFDKLPEAMTV